MKRKGKLPVDPKVFLSKVNGGRTISDYRKDQIVYRQGDPADSVFFIRSGKVKKTVVSEQGKEAVKLPSVKFLVGRDFTLMITSPSGRFLQAVPFLMMTTLGGMIGRPLGPQ